MSYYNLVKRNLNFFFNNLSDETSDEISNIKPINVDNNENNLEGGVIKKKKTNKKKFNVMDFTIDDLEIADEEVFTNSRSINPFLKREHTPDIENERKREEEAEHIKDDEEGKEINPDDEENELKTSTDELIETIGENDINFDEDYMREQNINNPDIVDSNSSSENSVDSTDSEDLENDEFVNQYFNKSYATFGGKNISMIKDELGSDKDIEEYTKNVSGGLTGGNMKPIKKYDGKFYPYNLN